MGYYENATICINGHVISSSEANSTKFCSKCGKTTISSCMNCNSQIKGVYEDPEIVLVGFPYDKPSYCDKCGSAFPWTKQLLENATEIISLDEELSFEEKEIIRNALPDLIIETPSSPVATAKYRKYMNKALDYTKTGMKNLLIDVVSETVKKSIWG